MVRIIGTQETGAKTGKIAPTESGKTYQPSEGVWQTEVTPAIGSIASLLQDLSSALLAASGGRVRTVLQNPARHARKGRPKNKGPTDPSVNTIGESGEETCIGSS